MLIIQAMNRQRPVDLRVVEVAEWPAQAAEQLACVAPLGGLFAPQPPGTGPIVTQRRRIALIREQLPLFIVVVPGHLIPVPVHADPAALAQAVHTLHVRLRRVWRAFAAIGAEVCVPQFFLTVFQLRGYQLVHHAPGAPGRGNDGNGCPDSQQPLAYIQQVRQRRIAFVVLPVPYSLERLLKQFPGHHPQQHRADARNEEPCDTQQGPAFSTQTAGVFGLDLAIKQGHGRGDDRSIVLDPRNPVVSKVFEQWQAIGKGLLIEVPSCPARHVIEALTDGREESLAIASAYEAVEETPVVIFAQAFAKHPAGVIFQVAAHAPGAVRVTRYIDQHALAGVEQQARVDHVQHNDLLQAAAEHRQLSHANRCAFELAERVLGAERHHPLQFLCAQYALSPGLQGIHQHAVALPSCQQSSDFGLEYRIQMRLVFLPKIQRSTQPGEARCRQFTTLCAAHIDQAIALWLVALLFCGEIA